MQTLVHTVPYFLNSDRLAVAHSTGGGDKAKEQRLHGERPLTFIHVAAKVEFIVLTPPQSRRLIFRCKVTKRRRGYGYVCFT